MQSENILGDQEYWNKRAATFSCGSDEAYKQRFSELLSLEPGQSILDMGCATGTFAIPFGRKGHSVYACDFAKEMLEILDKRAAAENLPVTSHLLAWDDDWQSTGLGEKSVDVAIASRSLGFKNKHERIQKLDAVARHKAAITVSASVLPSREPQLLTHLGREIPQSGEVSELVTLLITMGRLPVVSYMLTLRPMIFLTLADGAAELRKMAGPEAFNVREQALFDAFVAKHFRHMQNTDPKSQIADGWELDYPLPVIWAFIGWRTDGKVWL